MKELIPSPLSYNEENQRDDSNTASDNRPVLRPNTFSFLSISSSNNDLESTVKNDQHSRKSDSNSYLHDYHLVEGSSSATSLSAFKMGNVDYSDSYIIGFEEDSGNDRKNILSNDGNAIRFNHDKRKNVSSDKSIDRCSMNSSGTDNIDDSITTPTEVSIIEIPTSSNKLKRLRKNSSNSVSDSASKLLKTSNTNSSSLKKRKSPDNAASLFIEKSKFTRIETRVTRATTRVEKRIRIPSLKMRDL